LSGGNIFFFECLRGIISTSLLLLLILSGSNFFVVDFVRGISISSSSSLSFQFNKFFVIDIEHVLGDFDDNDDDNNLLYFFIKYITLYIYIYIYLYRYFYSN